MLNRYLFFPLLLLLAAGWQSCSKNPESGDTAEPYVLSYGDSILYMKPVAGDYIVHPLHTRPGTYNGFPDGIEIDETTGAINVTKSETGLRYRISHISLSGDTTETLVVLSGITFRDRFYNLSAGDSVARPVYNASELRQVPLPGSLFDEGNIANTEGCTVNPEDGSINLSASLRQGIFGPSPRNDDQKTVEIQYRINDASGKSKNKLKVLLYWYNSMADVPDYLWEILNDRTTQGVFLRGSNQNGSHTATDARTAKVAKPRPPCVVIVDH